MEFNKTYLIVGGTAVAALASGGAGGYFLAKKKFYDSLDEIIQRELKETVKHYSMLLKEAKTKPATPEEALKQVEEEKWKKTLDDQHLSKQELSKAKKIIEEKGYGETPAAAYNKIVQGNDGETITRNIFRDEKSEEEDDRPTPKSVRNRKGRFVSPGKALKDTEIEDAPPVELITVADFFGDTMGYSQGTLVWYLDGENGTLMNRETEEDVDIEDVGGAEFLSLLPNTEPDEQGEQIICVRNHGDRIDYTIKLSYEDLAEVQDLAQD